MAKKRIAIFVEKLYGGGVEKILQTILMNFDYERYDVSLYSSKYEELREGFYPDNLEQHNYFSNAEGNVLNRITGKINNKIRLFVYYHFSPTLFYRLFIRKRYDVGIAFIEGYATRILSGAPRGMKKNAWLHTDVTRNHWTGIAYRTLEEERNTYRSMNKIICVSRVVKEKASELFGLSKTLQILYNPIDRDGIIAKSKEIIDEVSLGSSCKVRLITLGSLIHVKGYDRLLRVAKRLCDERPDLEILILGEGSLRKDFEKYINDNNLTRKVILLEFKNNPYPYIAQSDIYVCSSYAEGFNTAITEALVLGKPVVSTECSGVKEQLGENNEYGICTPNSEDGLYEGIKQMLLNDNLSYYTRQAEIRGRDFTLDKSMNEIYRLIDE